MNKSLIVLGMAVLLVGCSTKMSPQASKLRVSTLELVKDCKYLGEFNGWSGHGGTMMSNVGIQNARNEAREKASAAGATHIVWIFSSGGYSSTAKGAGYKCR